MNIEVLVCLDVDGTLVDADGNIFPGAQDLVSISKPGVAVALCSARPPISLHRLSRSCGGCEFIIGYQGAIGCSTKPGRSTLWRETIPPEIVTKIVDIAYRHSLDAWFFDEESWYCDSMTPAVYREESIIRLTPKILGVAPLNLLKISLIEEESCKSITSLNPALIESISNVEGFLSHPYMLEIVSKTVGPLKGVDQLRNFIGNPEIEIICVGDAQNDLGMLSIADMALTFEDSILAKNQMGIRTVPSPENGGLVIVHDMIISRLVTKLEQYDSPP